MGKKIYAFWILLVGLALVRVIILWHSNVPVFGDCLKQAIVGYGTVIAEPERKDGGQVMVVRVEKIFSLATSSIPATSDNILSSGSESCVSDIYLRIKTKLYPRFIYGDNVIFSGKVSRPFNFKSDTGREFDYQGYLAKDDIFYEIKNAKVQIKYNDHEKTNNVYQILFYLKRNFVAHLEQVLGEPHSALAAGLVVGEKSALGKDLLEDFRIVGLIHIVVLSGFNITIVGDALRRILAFLPRVWGIGIGGIGITLFGIMVGGGATVVRSCFMAGVALLADLIRRDYDVTRALFFAGLMMIIQNPLIIFNDPSFQLSFLATLGLILLAGPIEKRIQFLPEKFGIRGIVASTIATQIFVSPYILYMMGQISIIGMLVNILVLPIIPATMLVVFLTGATGFVWLPLAHIFGWVAHLLLTYELSMVEFFARVPYASLTFPKFSSWWVVGFYSIFTILFLVRKYTMSHHRQKIQT